ncbi:hypothetical protein ADICYQ_3235 [Cyclobacterium qasimii M12-11B]|uniref:Uncharacterized protein n=1 Tax=Cyclobacterium qasimii M12-11B TaxID=641524 RepID=S7WM39_9BACT|nr:hypothetical protein ADICYQ_3235 [Cyclobacterium qasimii M12-11B]
MLRNHKNSEALKQEVCESYPGDFLGIFTLEKKNYCIFGIKEYF